MTLRKSAPRANQRWLVLSVTIALITLLAVPAAMANLTGSNFNGSDGDLVGDGTANSDWCALTQAQLNAQAAPDTGVCPEASEVSNLNVFTDKPSGTGDDSLGQGAKESISCPTVVSGSIPPQKSDLTRFYVASETAANDHFYLYLAWERTNILGNANMDFEFNQSTTLCANSNLIPTRTAGDILVLYDFTNGGGNPVLSVRTWTGSAWGPAASVISEAKVNAGTVIDPIEPDAPRSLPGLTFGEAALDLTASGIIDEGECAPFASAYLKSRSSASFPAELKDFIAPHATSLSNCGAVAITKDNGKGDALEGAVFSVTDANGEVGTITTGADGTGCLAALAPGDYTVTETDAPDGYALADPQNVTVTGSSGDCDTATPLNFSDTPLSEIEITFTSLAGAGVTAAAIDCDVAEVSENGAADPAFDDTDEVFTDLEPGLYTCTIDVDP